jgi:putative FmdB family regulatory protein
LREALPDIRGTRTISRYLLRRWVAGTYASGPVVCDHAPAVPTYDYQCRSCGHTTEVIHSMQEEGPSTCERCGGQLRRVLFPTGIIFKGSGFYKTDSRGSAAGDSTASKPSGDKAVATAPESSASGGSSTESSSTNTSSPAAKKESAGS